MFYFKLVYLVWSGFYSLRHTLGDKENVFQRKLIFVNTPLRTLYTRNFSETSRRQ